MRERLYHKGEGATERVIGPERQGIHCDRKEQKPQPQKEEGRAGKKRDTAITLTAEGTGAAGRGVQPHPTVDEDREMTLQIEQAQAACAVDIVGRAATRGVAPPKTRGSV